jgi:hypothetical protein
LLRFRPRTTARRLERPGPIGRALHTLPSVFAVPTADDRSGINGDEVAFRGHEPRSPGVIEGADRQRSERPWQTR